MPSTYSYEFHTSDWVEKAVREWVLIVNKNKHGMGNKPKIQILMKNEDGFEEVIASHQFNDKGDITIGSSKAFEGKVLISWLENDWLFEKIKTNTQQIRTLTGVRDTLLPKVMSGEILTD